MAFEDSRNCILYVSDGASPPAFNALSGQADTNLNLSAARISTSNKTSGVFGTSLAGRREFTVSARGFPDWPDLDGIQAVMDKIDGADADPNHDMVIILNAAGLNYRFTGQTSQCEINAPDGQATSYNMTAGLAQGVPVRTATAASDVNVI